jgi:hypothetical protein
VERLKAKRLIAKKLQQHGPFSLGRPGNRAASIFAAGIGPRLAPQTG